MKQTFRFIKPIERITHLKPNATMMLFLASVLAVIMANSSLSTIYHEILEYPINLTIGGHEVFSHHGETMTLLQFVNDVLMVIFFLAVGLEIKQEILVGELSSFKKAMLPIVGAIGGMIVPVLFFLLVVHEGPGARGAAIPMSTDIAFALAALAVLGSRVPASLKVFLTALAVADDIGGIIVIALFYSSHINIGMLAIAFGILFIMYLMGRMHVSNLGLYFVCTFFVWLFFLQSGIHTTIAGVLAAFMIPARPGLHAKNLRAEMRFLFEAMPNDKIRQSGSSLILSHNQINVINSMRKIARKAISPMQLMEEYLSPIVGYFVLPLFAFANAGITLGGVTADALWGVPMAVFLGLFVGKPLGIYFFTYGFVKMRLCPWPEGMSRLNLMAVSLFGGIGFTVSLFIATLSYAGAEHLLFLNEAKLGIFVASIFAAVVGIVTLRYELNLENAKAQKS